MAQTKKYTEEDLKKIPGAQLIQLARDPFGITYGENPTKRQVVEDILDAQAAMTSKKAKPAPEPEPEEEDDDSEVVDDDEELDDEELDEADLDDEEEDEVITEKSVAPKVKAKTAATKKQSERAKINAAAGEETYAAKQVATILGTEAKTLRQFFRSSASTTEAVGSGGRYEFLKSDIPQIKKEFETWRSAHAARGSKRGPKGSSQTIENIEEVESIEELEDDELDDEVDDADLELDDELDEE